METALALIVAILIASIVPSIIGHRADVKARKAREEAALARQLAIHRNGRSIRLHQRWGYTFEIDSDRNRLVGRKPADSIGMQNKIWSLDSVPVDCLRFAKAA